MDELNQKAIELQKMAEAMLEVAKVVKNRDDEIARLRAQAVSIQNEAYEAGAGRARADAKLHFELWAHLCSEHAGIFNHEMTLTELMDEHDHEHKGPGTIRNHDPKSHHYSLKRLGEVLSEADDPTPEELAKNIPPCDCGYSRSDSMTNHHESCAWLQYGRKHKLEVTAFDQRDS